MDKICRSETHILTQETPHTDPIATGPPMMWMVRSFPAFKTSLLLEMIN